LRAKSRIASHSNIPTTSGRGTGREFAHSIDKEQAKIAMVTKNRPYSVSGNPATSIRQADVADVGL